MGRMCGGADFHFPGNTRSQADLLMSIVCTGDPFSESIGARLLPAGGGFTLLPASRHKGHGIVTDACEGRSGIRHALRSLWTNQSTFRSNRLVMVHVICTGRVLTALPLTPFTSTRTCVCVCVYVYTELCVCFGAAYARMVQVVGADLDGDGDFDIVVADLNINGGAQPSWYENLFIDAEDIIPATTPPVSTSDDATDSSPSPTTTPPTDMPTIGGGTTPTVPSPTNAPRADEEGSAPTDESGTATSPSPTGTG